MRSLPNSGIGLTRKMPPLRRHRYHLPTLTSPHQKLAETEAEVLRGLMGDLAYAGTLATLASQQDLVTSQRSLR